MLIWPLVSMLAAAAAQVAGGGGVPAADVPALKGDIIITITTIDAAGATEYIKSTFLPPNNGASTTIAGAVPQGTIGLGTITGKIGVVQTVNWNAACTDAAGLWRQGMAAGALAAFVL